MMQYTHNDQLYFVSKTGVVFKDDTPLSQYDNGSGYRTVVLNGTPHYIHELLGLLYVPNPDNKELVIHKNGNIQDNRISNLKWISAPKIRNEIPVIKKNWKPGRGHFRPIRIIDKDTGELIQVFDSMTEASKVMNVPQKSIWFAINRPSIYKGYKWAYA